MTRRQLGGLRVIAIAGPLILFVTQPGWQVITVVLGISLACGVASAALTPSDATMTAENVPDR
jgi:hypothetical protein